MYRQHNTAQRAALLLEERRGEERTGTLDARQALCIGNTTQHRERHYCLKRGEERRGEEKRREEITGEKKSGEKRREEK
jgi:hypothetical protein